MATMFATSSSASLLTPREKMRLAKIALMEDEDRQAEARREQRRSRRMSSLAVGMPGPSGTSPTSSIASAPIPSPSGSLRSNRGPPTSILRRRPSSSLEQPASCPACPDPLADFNPSLSSSTGPDDSLTRTVRRRDSRVRFSETPLPPIATAPDTYTPEVPRLCTPQRRCSSAAWPRLSTASIASAASGLSEPFDLASTAASFSSVSSLAGITQPDAAFQPRPLAYPKLSRQLLHGTSPGGASTSSSVSDGSSQPTTNALIASEQLREVLGRPSLAFSPSASFASVISPAGLSPRPSFALSARADSRTSLGSAASALLSADDVSPSSSNSMHFPKGNAYITTILNHRTSDEDDTTSSDGKSTRKRGPPSINRGEWQDPEIGLSPRSGPSPSVHQDGVMPEQAGKVDGDVSPILQSKPLFTTEPLDRTRSDASDLSRDLVVEVAADELKPSVELSQTAEDAKMEAAAGQDRQSVSKASGRHQRSESTLSAVMSFPVPPERQRVLEVTLGWPIGVESPAMEEPTAPATVQPETLSLDSPTPQVQAEFQRFSFAQAMEQQPPQAASPAARRALRRVARSRIVRKISTGSDGETDDSDLDINTPLIQAAFRSRILSVNSRLLNSPSAAPRAPSPSPSPSPSTRPTLRRTTSSASSASLRSGVSLTSGKGWSGSESEEDDFAHAIRNITLRKLSSGSSTSPGPTPKLGSSSPTLDTDEEPKLKVKVKRPSLDLENRLSNLSQMSESSAAETALLTPTASMDIVLDLDVDLTPRSVIPSSGSEGVESTKRGSGSSSGSSEPGDFPWGRSSPSSSPGASPGGEGRWKARAVRGKTLYEALRRVSTAAEGQGQGREMPRPKREISEEWGEPEVLVQSMRVSLAGSAEGGRGWKSSGDADAMGMGGEEAELLEKTPKLGDLKREEPEWMGRVDDLMGRAEWLFDEPEM